MPGYKEVIQCTGEVHVHVHEQYVCKCCMTYTVHCICTCTGMLYNTERT